MTDRILIAGVGNVFLGDDGFGVEVSRRLTREQWPAGIRVLDVGIRGLHLAYELLDRPGLLVILDATSRGGVPGTLYLIEPELDPGGESPEAHSLSLPSVFAMLRSLGGEFPRTRLIGCEPASLAEGLGLSAPVERAVEQALRLVREVVDAELSGEGERRWPGISEGSATVRSR